MKFTTRGGLFTALICALAAITSPVTAISRKADLKQTAMSQAKAYLKLILPPGVSNTSGTFTASDLLPPTPQPDEMSVAAAKKIAYAPGANPILRYLIDEAVTTEMNKVTIRYDTIRLITPLNPMEPDAFKIHSLMFIKFKRDGRVTARLAGCGNQQDAASYDSTFASTSDHHSHTMVIAAYYAYAVQSQTLDSLIHSDFDITGAFLQNRLPRSATGGKQLVMKLPTSLPHPWAGRWVEVVGALYGLKQSNAIFQADLTRVLATINFLPAHAPDLGVHTAPDSSLYHCVDPTNPSLKCTLPMHVDDGQVISTSPALVVLLRSTLEQRYGPLTWNDVSTQHTGTTMTRHPSGAIAFDMSKHIQKTLTKLGMDKITPSLTPCSLDLFNADPTGPLAQPSLHPTLYQTMVGDLTYISRNRHDISKNVTRHQMKMNAPTLFDEIQVVRTLRYLKAFPDTPAIYYTTEGPTLCAHADASFANQPLGKSTTSLTLTIGSNSAPFLCKTFVQNDTALDPCSAEYYSLAPICQLILRFRNLLAAIGFPQSSPTTIFVDNKPAIDLAMASTIPRKSRYIQARHHFVRQCVADNTIQFQQRNTNYHSPDLNTKPHGPTSHHFLTKIMMNLEAPLFLCPTRLHPTLPHPT